MCVDRHHEHNCRKKILFSQFGPPVKSAVLQNNSHPLYVRQLETLFKMASKLSISAVNGLDYGDFIQRFGNVVENTSLCAAAVCARRPFYSFDSFVSSMSQFIDELPKDGRAGILRSHPDLRWPTRVSNSRISTRTDACWHHYAHRGGNSTAEALQQAIQGEVWISICDLRSIEQKRRDSGRDSNTTTQWWRSRVAVWDWRSEKDHASENERFVRMRRLETLTKVVDVTVLWSMCGWLCGNSWQSNIDQWRRI